MTKAELKKRIDSTYKRQLFFSLYEIRELFGGSRNLIQSAFHNVPHISNGHGKRFFIDDVVETLLLLQNEQRNKTS